MPKYEGVYEDGRGAWYFKANLGRDPVSGKRVQVTKRGFATASDASRARRTALEVSHKPVTASGTTTVNELLDRYFEDLDADRRLSEKTRYDYRTYAGLYLRPLLGRTKVRAVTPEVVLGWQRALIKDGKAANTIRLARAPLSGALKLAVAEGMLPVSPMVSVPRPASVRKIAAYWSPQQAREFLASEQHDRLYPLWSFLLGCGLRIGELVWLRWSNIDLTGKQAHIVEFATRLGWELVPSPGKSRSAVRSVDLDDFLVDILNRQRELQRFEARAPTYVPSDFVFTTRKGGSFHPMSLSRTLAKRSTAAGLTRLTAHGLRHTSATLMLASGVPPKVAAERLGHADATLFMNRYSHVTPTMQRDAAAKIGQALFGP